MGHPPPTSPLSKAFSSFHLFCISNKDLKQHIQLMEDLTCADRGTAVSSFQETNDSQEPCAHQALPSYVHFLQQPSISQLICYIYGETPFPMRLSIFLKFTELCFIGEGWNIVINDLSWQLISSNKGLPLHVVSICGWPVTTLCSVGEVTGLLSFHVINGTAGMCKSIKVVVGKKNLFSQWLRSPMAKMKVLTHLAGLLWRETHWYLWCYGDGDSSDFWLFSSLGGGALLMSKTFMKERKCKSLSVYFH